MFRGKLPEIKIEGYAARKAAEAAQSATRKIADPIKRAAAARKLARTASPKTSGAIKAIKGMVAKPEAVKKADSGIKKQVESAVAVAKPETEPVPLTFLEKDKPRKLIRRNI